MKIKTAKKVFDHSGSTFDSFLEEEGILEETEAVAIKRVLAWQLEQAMRKQTDGNARRAKGRISKLSQVS